MQDRMAHNRRNDIELTAFDPKRTWGRQAHAGSAARMTYPIIPTMEGGWDGNKSLGPRPFLSREFLLSGG